MRAIKLFFTLMMLCALNSCDKLSTKSKEPMSLDYVMTIDMVRHGDRAPIIWSPNIMKNIWTKEEIKQLTKKGAKESEELGKDFKCKHINCSEFLSPIASPEQIYVRSTDMQRTKETAKSLLEGMFGDSSKNLTIDVKEKKDDPCFVLSYKYKLSHEKVSQSMIDSSPKELSKKLKLEFDYINKQYGTNYSNPYDLLRIGDALFVG
jgi:hypothetical protein